MRKLLLVFGALLLILAACGEEGTEQTSNEVEQENIENEEKIQDEDDNAQEDEEIIDEEADEEDEVDSNKESSEENKSEATKQDVQDAAANVIWAQIDEDYTYLKSIVADGVTVNEENNTIDFNTDDATHTFDFLTGIEKDDLEFRFVEGEDTDRAIVGFAAIDYENEYSYVIEMIFNDVAGDWKLTSMDINK